MRVKTAIILAGGKGTRLQSVISDLPKPMASVRNRPFIEYIFDFLFNHQFEEIILSVGYRSEVIINHFGEEYRGMEIQYVKEENSLGTGGGIKLAAAELKDEPFFVFNGDTLFYADLWEMEKAFFQGKSDMVVGLKSMNDFERYGTVSLNEENIIISFNEKKYCKSGLINGGVYLMSNKIFQEINKEEFSFEKEILENRVGNLKMSGIISDNYFIDIGIPEDYERAKKELNNISIDELKEKIKQEKWTLFLDRDGVINERIPGNYVKYPSELIFIDNCQKTIADATKVFDKTIVVTNQQGVGKNLMRASMMERVHDYMIMEIEANGGKIDEVYYCPELDKNNPKCRKPNIGMGLQAKKDFPDIDFQKSIMVGDSITDIQFGKRLGMITIFVEAKGEKEIEAAKHEDIDFQFKDLNQFLEKIIS